MKTSWIWQTRKGKRMFTVATLAIGLSGLRTGVSGQEEGFTTLEPPQMRGNTPATGNGWKVEPLLTVGEQTATGGDFNAENLGYRIPGILDGIAAFQLDERIVRLLVNHEIFSAFGYRYRLANGTALTGARVSFVDISRSNRRVIGGGLAYDTAFDRAGDEVTRPVQLNEGETFLGVEGFSRFCSAYGVAAGTNGFVDNVYFCGEEVSGNPSTPILNGGQECAIDVDNRAIYVVPMLGRARYENVTAVENFGSDKVALLIGDDRRGAALTLYIGQKGARPAGGYDPPDFLVRNGLGMGNLYAWVSDNGDADFLAFHGTGNSRTGKFVRFEHLDPAPPKEVQISNGVNNKGFVRNFLFLGPIGNPGGAAPGDAVLQDVQIKSTSDASIDESNPAYRPRNGDTVPDNVLDIVTANCEQCDGINPDGVLRWNRRSVSLFNDYYGGDVDNAVVAVAFYVCLDADKDVFFGVGSENSFAIRVDGAVEAFRNTTIPRGCGGPDYTQEVVGPVPLSAGKHFVLFKVYGGDGGHCGRIGVFGDEDGNPLEGATFSVDPETDDCEFNRLRAREFKPGHDSLGFASEDRQDRNTWGDLGVGAFRFSKPEDLATNPHDGTQVVLSSTGLSFPGSTDSWGTTYLIEFDDDLGEALNASLDEIDNIPAEITILYDGDDAGAGQFDHPDDGLRNPDNLDWAQDGFIYINEDATSEGFCQTGGVEASVWRLHPETGEVLRILEMDREAVPQGQMIEFPEEVACGDWESSGVLDVTDLFPDTNGKTLLVLDVQAHGVAGGGIGGLAPLFPGFPAFLFDLNEGGQLLFAESPSPFPTAFVRGDCNDDGNVDIADAVCILDWLFLGAADPGCLAASNTNGDGAVDIADPVYLLGFLFGGGSAPADPFPDCGPGTLPADEALGCANPPNCQ